MKTKTHNNIHMQFIHLCSEMYRKTSPTIKRTEYTHRSLTYSTTLLFLKHMTVANILKENWKHIDQDIENGKHTPATLLARAHYSKAYIGILMHSQINKHMRLATDIMEMMPTEPYEYVTI